MTVKGKIVAKVAPSTTKVSSTGKGANPKTGPKTPNEKSAWEVASPWVHGVLGVASFVPGLSVVTGAADAAIYLAEGRAIEAGIAAVSMIPGGKVATTVGKAAKGAVGLVKGAGTTAKVTKAAHEAEQVAKAAKVAHDAKIAQEAAAKLAKEAEAVAAASKPAAKAAKRKKNTTVKPKKKMKCGEYGKYGELKKKTGEGKFDRDHIPSKSALKKKAEELAGEALTPAQERAIDNWGNSIAIPKQAHVDISPTNGTKNILLAPKDAKDLAGAARRDVEAMLKDIDKYDADGKCKKAYQRAAKRVLKMSNQDFDDALKKILKESKRKP